MISFLNRVISFSFYALFFCVPLAFTSDTSELFELNKMWLTWGLVTVIVAAWIMRMIFEGRIRIQRTPLDIPVMLFLLSQFISTIFSLDFHTSLWGYYSRFNGGFLSLLSYILLYYAFVSNVKKGQILRYLYTMIASGIVVALWGLPSHFGYDPTCLLFRGTLDVSCWTVAFQPEVRIFSTLGQPDWLSAYLAALIPLSLGLSLYFWEKAKRAIAVGTLATTFLFYLDFLYAKSRGGFVGLILSLVLFVAWYAFEKKIWNTWKEWKPYTIFATSLIGIFLITFLVGSSVDAIDKFDLPNLLTSITAKHQTVPVAKPATATTPPQSTISTGELGGTDSGKIRLFVWHGAVDAWMHYPIFGTGVETFAYAYYLFMPAGHNLTSEFGYLYNKAHNEYLNYLATTGAVGLGIYLIMIAIFLWTCVKLFLKRRKNESQDNQRNTLLAASFITSYIGILIINFFGFSVVIINLFLFIFPGFVFLITNALDEEKALAFPKEEKVKKHTSSFQWVFSGGIALIAIYFLYTLIVFWNADKAYGLGQNYVNAGDYQSAYQPLHEAIQMRPGEPVFQDETSLDDSVLAAALYMQDKTATTGAQQVAQEALSISDNLTTTHPNIVTFWKTRVRVMYALSQMDPSYLQQALVAIQRANQLAPTDAKVSYNLGLLYGQTGDYADAIKTLQHTIELKKDYHDAYYALGLFYHSAGVDKNGVITNPIYAQKAVDEMHFILNNFNTQDSQALTALKAWGAQ